MYLLEILSPFHCIFHCRYAATQADPALLHTLARVSQHRLEALHPPLLSCPATGLAITVFKRVGISLC